MHNKLILFFLALASFFLIAEKVQALEIIYPGDRTFLRDSGFIVIKTGTSPEIEGVTVEINGLKSGIIDISAANYKAVFQDFLILEPEYASGENVVKVEALAGGKVIKRAVAEIFVLSGPYELPPSGYRPFIMHTPEKEKLCSPCHNMRPAASQLENSSAETNPCASCHKRKQSKKFVHGPAGVYRCTYCHIPSSRPSKYVAREGDAKVCNECHLDKVKEFKRNKYVHGPVAVGMCSVCHNPHASDYKAQLHDKTNAVCLSCHENLDVKYHFTQGIGKGHPVDNAIDPRSRTGEELSCTSCHNPHGGVTEQYFTKAVSKMMFCQECHRK